QRLKSQNQRDILYQKLCTQAWAKFYEILGTFKLLPDNALKSGELNSIHLCEAPGAFISALNHFLKTSGLHYDRLIAHTLPWWFFGSDNTGDIMLQKHLLELPRFVSNMRSVDLVTADGSFDCRGDPGEQERLVAPLQYCEAVCALLLLGTGGSFVLKMFTLFEHSSVCLLYLPACCFRSVNVFKPGTSKSGNSELYIVCLDYQHQGSTLVIPLCSVLTRFTSGLVFTLHLCFRYITFHCLSGWPPAVLVCIGFSPPSALPRLLDFLRDVLEKMKKVQLELGRQILQFVPLEELLRGELPRFLSSFNTAVVRQQLHVLMQVE
uniref:Cap-specific mRNA (nucleoside-2'-O-)-methyltransferase 2 n=1 Tax=Sinocyclocheilus anshuiensis TaxID=1608454 RepID=A0A671P306_9TELE